MTRIAVLNSRGAQAGAIANRLERAGFDVSRLSRTGGDGYTAVDPQNEDALATALDGASGVAFTVPQDYRPGVREAYAERLVRAAEHSGVERLVVNTAGPIHDELDHSVAHDLRRVRDILRGSAVPAVVLQPTSFLDNLRLPWAIGAILGDGVFPYPVPEAARISWISHDDLGDFVAAAFRRDVAGRVFKVGGPEAITGAELAAAVGEAAARPVRHVVLPLDVFSAALNAELGTPAGDHVAALYRHYRHHPGAGALDPAEWSALGVEPETAAAWAARQDWRVPAGPQA